MLLSSCSAKVMHVLFLVVLSLIAGLLAYAVYLLGIAPRFNSLQILAGPPARSWFKTHLKGVLEYVDDLRRITLLLLTFCFTAQ